MPHSEASLKAALRRKLSSELEGSVVFPHEELIKVSAGVPDISVTWGDATFWIEAKYAKPKIRTKYKIQLLRMMQLNSASFGRAFYVVWAEKDGLRKTVIIPPLVLHNGGWSFHSAAVLASASGFEHNVVISHIKWLVANPHRAHRF